MQTTETIIGQVLMKKESIGKRLKRIFFYSFVNKVFLIFLFITVVVLAALLILLTENLRSIKYEQSVNMSDQILSSIDDFMEEKAESEKFLYQRLLQMRPDWETILSRVLDESGDAEDIQRLSQVQSVFSKEAYAIDSQFSGMYAASFVNDSIFSLGSTVDSGDYYYFETLAKKLQEGQEVSNNLVTSRGNHMNHNYSVFILDIIHEADDFTSDVGVLGICFHARSIRQSYKKLEAYLKGEVYILDRYGNIVYDSDAKYAKKNIPFEKMKGRSVVFEDKESIYNAVYNEHRDYYLVNRIPIAAINQDVQALTINIMKLMLVAVLAAVALTFLGSRYFAKRLASIGTVIDYAKGGKLTGIKTEKQADDDLGYIYRELVGMCAALNDHIEREYVYKLHQKEMEVYALQAQINPHFLYNTLESIRMNLYVKGDREASQMVYKLSEMFRNIMKKGPVVTLREEFNYVTAYLELHQFRLGKRMKFEFVAAAEVYHYATVKYILQPIIENTMIHGIQDFATEEEPGFVRIWSWKEEDDILIGVEDNGMGIPQQKLEEIQKKLAGEEMFQDSIGIYNVNNRLRIVYGDNYRLKIASAEGKGTAVTIRIKAMTKKELEDYVQKSDRG